MNYDAAMNFIIPLRSDLSLSSLTLFYIDLPLCFFYNNQVHSLLASSYLVVFCLECFSLRNVSPQGVWLVYLLSFRSSLIIFLVLLSWLHIFNCENPTVQILSVLFLSCIFVLGNTLYNLACSTDIPYFFCLLSPYLY